MGEKEIKYKIKRLKKIKKDMRVGTPARREMNRKIRALKTELEFIYQSNPEKQKLIEEIYKLEPHFLKIKLDLRKHSIENLQKHIDIVKTKRGI